MKTVALLVLLGIPLCAQEQPRPTLTTFRISQLTLIASTTADVLSSRGLIEQNPILGRGPFTLNNQGVKSFAITGGLILIESLLVRRFPSTQRVFSIVNFGASAAHAGATIHNVRQ